MGASEGHTAGGMVREMLREATMGSATPRIPPMSRGYGWTHYLVDSAYGIFLGGLARGLFREAQAGPPPVGAAWTAPGVGPDTLEWRE